jgi:hypothetical protein
MEGSNEYSDNADINAAFMSDSNDQPDGLDGEDIQEAFSDQESNESEETDEEQNDASDADDKENDDDSEDSDENDVEASNEEDQADSGSDSEYTEEETKDLNNFALEMSGGDYETFDDLVNSDVFQRAKDYNEVKEENERLVSEKEQLESKQPEYASEFVAKLNDWVAKGGNPQEYLNVQTLDYDSMSDVDVLINTYSARMKGSSREEIEAYVAHKYKQDESLFTDQELKVGAMDMKYEADNARGELNSQKVDMTLPDSEKELMQFEKTEEDRMTAWEPNIDGVLEDFTGVDIDLGEHGTFEYAADDSDKNSIADHLYDIIEDTGLDPNSKEDLSVVSQLATDRFKSSKFNDIVKAVVTQIGSKKDKEWLKETNKSSSSRKSEAVVDTKQEISNEDAVFNFLRG